MSSTNGKTGRKSGANGRFATGADPRRGVGKPGRSGRKPLAFVAACARLVDSQVLPKVEKYLAGKPNPSDPAWRWCADYVTTYGKGKPPQQLTVAGQDGEQVRFTLSLGDAHVGDD